MAPREAPKAASKVHLSAMKTKPATLKGRSSPATAIKKRIVNKKPIEKVPLNMDTAMEQRRQRTNTAPTIATPKPKEKIPVPSASNSVTKSAKKQLWKRRPLPAHSGVPVPEKMKQLFKKQLGHLNDSL